MSNPTPNPEPPTASTAEYPELYSDHDGLLDHILITPDGRMSVQQTSTWPGNILAVLQHGVGGYIERVALRPGIDAWVDDEGLLNGSPFNPVGTAVCRLLTDRPVTPLHGTVLICGSEGADTVDLPGDHAVLVLGAWLAVRTHVLHHPAPVPVSLWDVLDVADTALQAESDADQHSDAGRALAALVTAVRARLR